MAEDGDTNADIQVEVAFARPERQEIITLAVSRGCSAREAVTMSGIQARLPDIDIGLAAMGIFGRRLDGVQLPEPGSYILEEGDRVEIYRELLNDPKQARLARAKKSRQE